MLEKRGSDRAERILDGCKASVLIPVFVGGWFVGGWFVGSSFIGATAPR